MIRKAKGLMVLLMVLIICLTALPAQAVLADEGEWPQFHNDASLVGTSSGEAPDDNNLKWSSADIGAVSSSSVAIAGGKIFVNCGNALTCLDENSGEQLWSQPITSSSVWGSWSSPAYSSGRVYIATDKIYCFDMNGGEALWSFEMDSDACDGSVTVSGGYIFAQDWDSSGSRCYCLNESDGTLKWQFPVAGYGQGTPACSDGKVYFTSWGNVSGNVYCVDVSSGNEVWHTHWLPGGDLPDWDTCGSPCVADGKVFVTTYNFYGFGELVALNATDGSFAWDCKAAAIERTDSTPAFYDGRIYLCGGCTGYSDEGSRTYCFDATSGDLIWRTATGTETGALDVGNWTCSAVVADGKVFVGKPDPDDYSNCAGTCALSTVDGSLVWSSQYGGSSPAVCNGAVFTIDEGKVWAFGSADDSVTISLRATGLDGDIFNITGYSLQPGDVTEDGITLDKQTAMGALVYYCQQNSLDITLQSSEYGTYVYQIGSNTSDENNWMYYVNGSSPWTGADQYSLTDGDVLHWVNYLLGRYSLSLSLDKTSIMSGDEITAAVSFTNGDGQTVPAGAAQIYVSSSTDGYGNPAATGSPAGQTDSSGSLTFTWNEAGTFYPYAEWNGLNTLYQWPVASFTCENAPGDMVKMSVSPSTRTVAPGEVFTVTLNVTTDAVSRGAQCGLFFDPALVQVNSVSAGDFYSGWATSNGSGIYWQVPSIDNTAGTITGAAIALTGGYPDGPSGTGSFIEVQMTALNGANGTSPLTLSGVIISDADANPLDATLENGEVIVASNIPGPTTVIQINLAEGWNTFSTPISLEAGHSTLDEILAGIDFDLVYGYNAGAQIWTVLNGTYELRPCEAVYIHTLSEQTLSLVVNGELTFPPSKYLSPGWNLVSLASLEEMSVADALLSVDLVAGNLQGYTFVLSHNTGCQEGWTHIKGEPVVQGVPAGWLKPGFGYWTFMVNGGTMNGFTMTPLE